MTRLLLIVAPVATILAGCQTNPPYPTKATNPAQQAELDRDIAQCEYEAKLAVRRPQAVSSGSLLAEYDMSEQRKELMRPCLKAKGWNVK